MQHDIAVKQVLDELARAEKAAPPMPSDHDGYAVILEELDELWELVKLNPVKRVEAHSAMIVEARQVAAMALRFLKDRC
jgi:hypothetical protein